MKLDFSDAMMTGPILDIQAESRGGRLVLVTRSGTEVDVDGVVAHGGRVKMRPDAAQQNPRPSESTSPPRPMAAS